MKNLLVVPVLVALTTGLVGCASVRPVVETPGKIEETNTETFTKEMVPGKTTETTVEKTELSHSMAEFLLKKQKMETDAKVKVAEVQAEAANPCGGWNPRYGCQTRARSASVVIVQTTPPPPTKRAGAHLYIGNHHPSRENTTGTGRQPGRRAKTTSPQPVASRQRNCVYDSTTGTCH